MPIRALASLTLLLAAAAPAQAPDRPPHASRADIAAQIATMEQAMKPDQGFAWQPLVGKGDAVAAIEIWRRPGKPAVHPAQAEYVTVLSGEGMLLMGGALVDPAARRADLIEGSRIEGGATQALKAGDVIMVPAGVPHWFGITGRELVLLGTKLPQPKMPDVALGKVP